MSLLPSCKDVQSLATEYQEGHLSFSDRFGIRVHLLLCWACRAFIRGLEALPGITKRALAPPGGAPPEAQKALAATLKRLKS